MMSRGRLTAMPRAARCLAALLNVVVGYGAETATAQDLAEYYRKLWFRENAERILERRGMRVEPMDADHLDRKSTRLNSSHVAISYAVFCLKKKNTNKDT